MRSTQPCFAEDDLLPLSGLQHLAFCERQWALIHIEQQWQENRLTAEGRVGHQHVHDAATEARRDLITVRGLPVHSLRLGLSGQCDMVEFRRATENAPGVHLPGRPGAWLVFPIEYKRGRPKKQICDLVQLCAQALCIEEMLGATVPQGALFYASPRRRLDVPFSADLREQTEQLTRRMRELYNSRTTPAPIYTRGCESCSLKEICQPKRLAGARSVAAYLAFAGQDS